MGRLACGFSLVINVGRGDGHVLTLPERKRTGLGGELVSFGTCLPLCHFSVKSRSFVFIRNKCDDIYALLEMREPVVQANFPSA